MEGEGRAMIQGNVPAEDTDDGGIAEKLLSPSSAKAKRIASPRWSKHETLVMIDAKRKHELELQQANTKGRGGATLLADVNKWELVAASCRAVGIDRDGKMCRKRWFNLLTEFKKIRNWRKSSRAVEGFWDMSGDERRERKLPAMFDQEVYVAMETFATGKSGLSPDAFESVSRNVNDDGLFSEIDQDVQPAEEVPQLENGSFPLQSKHTNGLRLPPLAPDPPLQPGMTGERPQNLKKRKHPSAQIPEEAEPRDPYAAILESTSRSFQAALTDSVQAMIRAQNCSVHAQIEAQKQENALDRALRREQGDKLLGVLTTLVDTLGKIADKL